MIHYYEEWPYTEEDPKPQATREQDPEYILTDILLKEVAEVRETLKHLSILERSNALILYVRYGVLSLAEHKSLSKERRLYGAAHLPLRREEYLSHEEFEIIEKDIRDRLEKARIRLQNK